MRTIALFFLSAAVAQAAMSVSWQTNADKSISLMSPSGEAGTWLVVGTVESITAETETGLPAPIVSGWAVTATNTTGATIAWNTDIATTVNTVDYGTVDGEFGSTASAADGGTTHSAALTGLTPGTSYQFRVRSFANSQWAIGDPVWFATPSEAPPSTVDLTNGLFAYFNFDSDPFTNAINGMALSESGSITNDATQKIAGQSAGGWKGQAVDTLRFPTNTTILSPTAGKEMWIMGWFRPGETNSRMTLVSKSTTADPQREWAGYYSDTADTVGFTVYPNGTAASATSVYAETNALYRQTWYFYAFGFSVPQGQIYATYGTTNAAVPTFAIKTNTVSFGSGVSTTTLLEFGRMAGSAYPLNGREDENAIYTRILSWAEVEAYRTNTLAGRTYPNLVP